MGKRGGFFYRPGVVCTLCFLLAAAFCPSLFAQTPQVDPYYLRMFQQGIQAFELKNYPEAAQKLELAIFGLKDEKTIAKGSVYICLSHYYLEERSAECEQYFKKAEQFVRANTLDALELNESTKIAFSKVWNLFYPHEVLYRPRTQQDLYITPTVQELNRKARRLERQIEAVPRDIIAFYDLFQVYVQKQDRKKAKKTLEKMLKKNPAEILGFYHIGLLEFAAREFKSAVKNFEKFLELAVENPVDDDFLRRAWAHLILSYNYKGDKDKAFQLASEVSESLTTEIIEFLGLGPTEMVVLRDIMEKSKKSQ